MLFICILEAFLCLLLKCDVWDIRGCLRAELVCNFGREIAVRVIDEGLAHNWVSPFFLVLRLDLQRMDNCTTYEQLGGKVDHEGKTTTIVGIQAFF